MGPCCFFVMPPPIQRIAKNSGRALSVTPVHPVRMYVPIRVRAITPKVYGIYLLNFTGACMTLRRCVRNKDDNSCLFGF